MNKIFKKFIFIILIFISILFFISPKILAGNVIVNTDVIENADYYIKDIKFEDDAELIKKTTLILSIIQVFGTAVSVITLMIIGLKYMLGSLEEKAEYKGVLLPWLLGAFLLFTITTLPKLIYEATAHLHK